jgi:hypothetical protein
VNDFRRLDVLISSPGAEFRGTGDRKAGRNWLFLGAYDQNQSPQGSARLMH